MKQVYIFLLLLGSTLSPGQTLEAERIKQLLTQSNNDTSSVLLQAALAHSYLFFELDSGITLANEALQQARKLGFHKGEWKALCEVGIGLSLQGELSRALEIHFDVLNICRSSGDLECEARALALIGAGYTLLTENHLGGQYLRQACTINEQTGRSNAFVFSCLGYVHQNMNQLDSALSYQQRAYELLDGLPSGTLNSLVLTRIGIVEALSGNHDAALRYYHQALRNALQMGDLINQARARYRIAEAYHELMQVDSALHHAQLALVRPVSKITLLQVSNLLVKLYDENGDRDRAFHYLKLAMATNDILFGPEKFRHLQLLTLTEQQRQQQLLQEQAELEARFQRIGLSSGVIFLVVIAMLLWRNNKQHAKTNQELNTKNAQIEQQREALETTVAELKDTQTQLIEKEQMAALYHQQLKIQQVRNKIASELHDDIGSALSSIYLFSEVAKKEIHQDSLPALQTLEKIEHSSQQIMQSMSEIIWAIQPKNDDTANLMEKIYSFASGLLSARNICFRFDYPEQFLSVPIAMDVRRNIFLIFKETLNNIVKHSQATRVDMEVAFEQKSIRIGIQDNGKGFDANSSFHGNGLKNLFERAEQIGGSLYVDSQPGRGTHVCLQCTIP